MSDIIKSYLGKIDREFKTGKATEHTHRPALKDLIEELDSKIKATNEPKRVECGAPDFILRRDGLSVGYIETKDLGKSLDEAEDSDQLKRYKRSLPNLILTDYLEFRWFEDGQLRDSARLGRIGKGNKILLDKKGIDETVQLLKLFLESRPQPITTPKDLSERTAKLAHIIRDTIVEAFEKDKASSDLKDLREAFSQVLIPDLNKPEKVTEFADMYAQTIVYGLFAARCNHKGPESFQRLGAAREIPKTNPFLKKLFETITGSSLDEEPYVDFVDDLVQILANTDMEKVLENFGKRTRQEDPIVHFYETFLAAYDPKTRELRGVYYTPEPVVQYIVKSVDHILMSRFSLEGGLTHTADIVEYDREEAFQDEHGMPDRSRLLKTMQEARPKVLILDPACGTGTFLYAVMDFIRAEFMKRGDAGLWSAYVRDHLLPRLFGFELLMAPYAVAHFKLGMLLAGYDLPKEQRKQWQYDFEGDERLEIYLTNTLEEAPTTMADALWGLRILSKEANEASRVKRDLPIMVVLGNPPYSGHSANNGKWIENLISTYQKIDGIPLKEVQQKWLHDDYVKFIRWGQWRIEATGYGILAIVTNHGYLDNPTFRIMREQLTRTFDEIYILNLHGNSKKKERNPEGGKDENVFDIQQGVAIGVFIKKSNSSKNAEIYYSDLWGTRETKFQWLNNNDITNTKWNLIQVQAPFYLFSPQNADLLSEYNQGWNVRTAFPVNSVGIVTARDKLTIHFSREELMETVRKFASLQVEEAREIFNLGKDARDWKVENAQKDIQENEYREDLVLPVCYRPFDERFTYYSGKSRGFIGQPQQRVMFHMIAGKNIGLGTTRSTEIGRGWEHIFCASSIIQHHTVSLKEVNYLFPIYIYPTSKSSQQQFTDKHWSPGRNGRLPNLNPNLVSDLEKHLDIKFISDGHGDLATTFGPEDVFDYIYAIFHTPTYRQRYAEFLKIDFPRVPLTSSLDLFRKLCFFGEELVALHLLESPYLSQLITRYPVVGANIVEKGFPKFVVYDDDQTGYVFINKTQYFEGVPSEVWDFHVGGYQVCEKWLKDRRGRQLSFDDLMHYQKVIVALKETMRLMEEIDKAIPKWPIE